MSILNPDAGWPDIDGINTNERLLGGETGPLNRAASQLTARTKQLLSTTQISVDSLAELSGTLGLSSAQIATVSGAAGGLFTWQPGNNEDPDGAITVGQPGQPGRWVRQYFGPLRLNWFGALAGQDIAAPLASAAVASARYSNPTIVVPQPAGPAHYLLSGGVVIDIGGNGGLSIVGEGDFHRRVRIYHYGDNIGIWVRKNFALASEFWASGEIAGLDFQGCASPTDLVNPNSGANACGIRVSDTWGFVLRELDMRNYYQGETISLYNWTAWTEGTIVQNVMCRNSRRGIAFRRNTEAGNTAHNSFFRTQTYNFSFNAGVGGSSATAIDVGDGTTECFVYGAKLEATFWASAGGGHQIIRVRNASLLVDSEVTLWADGLAYAPGASSEVLQQVRADEGGVYQARTKVGSQQGRAKPLTDLNIVRRSTLWYSLNRLGAMYQGKPEAHAPGAVMYFEQAYTAAERSADVVHTLEQIPAGTTLRVTMRTRFSGATGTTGNPTTEVYTVGISDGNITANVGSITLNRVNQFSGGLPTAPANRLREGGNLLVPYLRNKNTNNNVVSQTSAGYALDFVIPAAPAGTPDMTVGVQIELL